MTRKFLRTLVGGAAVASALAFGATSAAAVQGGNGTDHTTPETDVDPAGADLDSDRSTESKPQRLVPYRTYVADPYGTQTQTGTKAKEPQPNALVPYSTKPTALVPYSTQ
ncbi:hypothetical protein [Streptomyces sp. NPDC020681]|uniref:hypothetical protein n=1 Tax=Streptomyces sp. NPDC020681 TaxID=3365083 RepID=UPI00379D6F77